MNLQVFAIYDSKTAAYGTPFFLHSSAQAIRSFSDIVLDSKGMISKHPSDYKLYELGEYTDKDGKITPLKETKFLASADTFVNNNTQPTGDKK